MSDEHNTLDLATKIVCAYVAKNNIPGLALGGLLTEVHRSLCALSMPARPRQPTEAEIEASIRADTLISFEDGRPYKALRRHLAIRGLTPEAYRAKWGLPIDYPLVSATYSARRSRISRDIGRNRGLRLQQAAE
ncbi:MucR family transcriptional regulator [Methylobacterium sp. A54F]